MGRSEGQQWMPHRATPTDAGNGKSLDFRLSQDLANPASQKGAIRNFILWDFRPLGRSGWRGSSALELIIRLGKNSQSRLLCLRRRPSYSCTPRPSANSPAHH